MDPAQINWARVHGRSEPPTPLVALRAGPVDTMLEGIDLRYVRRGESEAIRRIYLAVRDHNWSTIPVALDHREIDSAEDRFRVSFRGRYRQDAVDFGIAGEITGDSDGSISFQFDGSAIGAFAYNRIGFCVLYPAEVAGHTYRAEAQQGQLSGTLPALIGQQRFENGVYVALHEPTRRLEVDLGDESHVRIEFSGDEWETEDQRNWSDASFKAYSTPLRLGFPHHLDDGERVSQQLRIEVAGPGNHQAHAHSELTVSLSEDCGSDLPSIGAGLNPDGATLASGEIDLLQAAGLRHLRIDLHPYQEGVDATLDMGEAAGEALDCPLEVALFISRDDEPQLAKLCLRLSRARIVRVLVFDRAAATATPQETTEPALVEMVRRHLADVSIGGGTDMYFCELNRTRPEVSVMDVVSWSLTPQVHAFDERSIAETLSVQGTLVRSAREFMGTTPLAISPLTLLPAANPHATDADQHVSQKELPAGVDARQGSLFGAAYTLGSFGELGRAGIASITAYETTGCRGLVQPASGPRRGSSFPASGGEVHPLWFVFADLAGWSGADLLTVEVSSPLDATALGLRRGNEFRILVASLSPEAQIVRIRGVGFDTAAAVILDHGCVSAAVADPRRRTTVRMSVRDGEIRLPLAPYAYVRLDQDPGVNR